MATSADLDRALEAAQRSWPVWRALGPQQRGRILRKASDLLRERADAIAANNRAWVAQHALFAPCVAAFVARLQALA